MEYFCVSKLKRATICSHSNSHVFFNVKLCFFIKGHIHSPMLPLSAKVIMSFTKHTSFHKKLWLFIFIKNNSIYKFQSRDDSSLSILNPSTALADVFTLAQDHLDYCKRIRFEH